jgi:hypothetical protein
MERPKEGAGGMSSAEFAARCLTPVLFFLWGLALGMPREFAEPRGPGHSSGQLPWVFGGIIAVAVGLLGFPFRGSGGVIAMLVVLLAVLPMALGGALSWWLRRKPSRGEGTAASPHPPSAPPD